MLQKPDTISATQFGKLFSEYNPRFVEVACRYVRDRSVAEDLVSESFMAFWEERERISEAGKEINVPAYIFTIVRNKCLNHLRRQLLREQIEKRLQTTRQRLLQADIHSLTACEPEQLISAELGAMLERAVGRMPELTRRVFQGSRDEGKSYREIAEELGIAFTHVNFEMRRAMKILREEFRDYLPIAAIILGFNDLI